MESPESTVWGRYEFLIRRLHSLTGLVPVGAYMVIHLLTNASILNSAGAFQKNVHTIHSLGKLLPVVEWVFIFIPLIFHAVIGVAIVRSGQSNTASYGYNSNVRYTLQRATGMIAFVFIFWHVFHMHGWIHIEPFYSAVKSMNGANFKPYNAASSAHLAMAGFVIPLLYLIGVGACVFHLANGIWTMGITWGVWTSPKAQDRAGWVTLVFGIGLMIVGSSAIVGVKQVNLDEALANEAKALDARLATGEISEHEKAEKAYSEDDLQAIREKLSDDTDDTDQAE